MSKANVDYVDSDYAAFEAMLPEFLPEDTGKYAVMADSKLVGVFETLSDADSTGYIVSPNGKYIVQRIHAAPLDLGIFSRIGIL